MQVAASGPHSVAVEQVCCCPRRTAGFDYAVFGCGSDELAPNRILAYSEKLVYC